MCTAYEIGKRGGSFPDHLKSDAVNILLGISETHLIRPTIPAPVILPDGTARLMKWGFRRSFAPKAKGGRPVTRSIVNSREDKLDGRTWKTAFAERRCLIPATSFYEWVERGGVNVPLRFERADDGWIWIAGIWEDHKEFGECFSMITTEPNAVLEPVHDRMPAVLAEGQITPFLPGELSEFGPSAVELEFAEADNFLKKGAATKKKSTGPAQQDLL
jgi:putative SOS response-associated peptidase YedK